MTDERMNEVLEGLNHSELLIYEWILIQARTCNRICFNEILSGFIFITVCNAPSGSRLCAELPSPSVTEELTSSKLQKV